MPTTSRKRILRISFCFAILFVALFLFRFFYGYYGVSSYDGGNGGSDNFFDNLSNMRKNYASEKISNSNMSLKQGDQSSSGGQPSGGDQSSTQQYEKKATVRSKTSHFTEDEARIRHATDSFSGSIQYEQSLGKKGSRELYLSIGIKPTAFDSFYLAVQEIGEVRSMVITKTDKTNEYRQLNARKVSLEKTLGFLNDLKSKGGAISDFVALHDKILDVETQLQQLGVDLGNYNTENEFCTLRFSLFEGTPHKKAGMYLRLKVVLEWTIKYYAFFVVALAGVLVCAFLLLVTVDKLKLLVAVVGKLKE